MPFLQIDVTSFPRTFPMGFMSQKISDYQRSKVYRAEGEAFHSFSPVRRLPTVREIQRYVDAITRSEWWKRRVSPCYRGTRIKVTDGRGRNSACARTAQISVPKWARKDWIILHELAHCMVAQSLVKHRSAHGREFAASYLDLVQHRMGKDAHDTLRAHFRLVRVKYTGKDEDHFRKLGKRKARASAIAAGEVEAAPSPFANHASNEQIAAKLREAGIFPEDVTVDSAIVAALKRWGYTGE